MANCFLYKPLFLAISHEIKLVKYEELFIFFYFLKFCNYTSNNNNKSFYFYLSFVLKDKQLMNIFVLKNIKKMFCLVYSVRISKFLLFYKKKNILIELNGSRERNYLNSSIYRVLFHYY